MRLYSERIADDWIYSYSGDALPDDAYDPLFVIESIIESNPGLSWEIIEEILNRSPNNNALTMLLFGPMRSWLNMYMEEWIGFLESKIHSPYIRRAFFDLPSLSVSDETQERLRRALR